MHKCKNNFTKHRPILVKILKPSTKIHFSGSNILHFSYPAELSIFELKQPEWTKRVGRLFFGYFIFSFCRMFPNFYKTLIRIALSLFLITYNLSSRHTISVTTTRLDLSIYIASTLQALLIIIIMQLCIMLA